MAGRARPIGNFQKSSESDDSKKAKNSSADIAIIPRSTKYNCHSAHRKQCNQ